jgi:hypothetical protein
LIFFQSGNNQNLPQNHRPPPPLPDHLDVHGNDGRDGDDGDDADAENEKMEL